MPKKSSCDIFVSGGGLAGLMTTLSLANDSTSVVCCDSNWDFTLEPSGLLQDHRVTALFNNSLEFLESLIPVESLLSSHGKRLAEIEVVEAGEKGEIKQVSSFKSCSIGRKEFGWVLPNDKLRTILVSQALKNPNITFLPKAGVKTVLTRTNEVHILLNDGARVVSKLLVGADGKDSQVREFLKINTRKISLPQGGITFNVRHPYSLNKKSLEIYRTGGPFTIIPLPGEDNYCSNIIWMDSIKNIETFSKLSTVELAGEATKRSLGMVGNLSIISTPVKWSGNYQMANKLNCERTVLIAEAAHNLPPLGAQGLNLTISDIKLLYDCISKSEDPGDPLVLRSYTSARYFPTLLKFFGTNFLNLLSFSNIVPLRTLRKEGTGLFSRNEQLQNSLIKFGLGEELFPFKPFYKAY